MDSDEIHVLGAGAIGCGLASALALGGRAPVLVTRWREHIETLRRDGLTVRHADGSTTRHDVRAQHYDDYARSRTPIALAYLTAKCQGTRPYGEVLAGRLAPAGCVVTVQNGFNLDELATLVGRPRTLGGAALFGAARTGPGTVRRTGTLSNLVIGELDAAAPAGRAHEVARLTTGEGWRTEVSGNIVGVVWSKWISNVMVNPLAVVFGLAVRELMEHPVARRLAVRVAAECGAVAAAEHVELTSLPTMDVRAICALADGDPPEAERRLRAFGALFPDTRVSSLQDVEAGRSTELGHLAGTMVERGRAAGRDVPTIAACYELARRVECAHARPGDLVAEAAGLASR